MKNLRSALKTTLMMLATMPILPAFAQINIVKNGGFETYTTCPSDSAYQIAFATGWGSIDTVPELFYCGPEYCNACSTPSEFDVPYGMGYYHFARSGVGMAQVRMYYDSILPAYGSWYNYLQGRFSAPLVAGKDYCVTFYTTITQGSQFAINRIGAYIDDGSIDTGQDSIGCSRPQSSFIPQIQIDSVINDTLNWVKIQGHYVAIGSEHFITIGNFYFPYQVDTVRRNPPFSYWGTSDDYSFYLFDDVSVIPSDAIAEAGENQWVSPGSDSAFIGIHDAGLPTTWYQLGISTPLCFGAGGFMVHPDTTTSYVVLLDLCGNVTTDTVTVFAGNAGISNVQPQNTFANLTIGPNPVTNSILNIGGVGGCVATIRDISGQAVLTNHINTERYHINVSMLRTGTYIIQITDPATGENTFRKLPIQ